MCSRKKRHRSVLCREQHRVHEMYIYYACSDNSGIDRTQQGNAAILISSGKIVYFLLVLPPQHRVHTSPDSSHVKEKTENPFKKVNVVVPSAITHTLASFAIRHNIKRFPIYLFHFVLQNLLLFQNNRTHTIAS